MCDIADQGSPSLTGATPQTAASPGVYAFVDRHFTLAGSHALPRRAIGCAQ